MPGEYLESSFLHMSQLKDGATPDDKQQMLRPWKKAFLIPERLFWWHFDWGLFMSFNELEMISFNRIYFSRFLETPATPPG